MARQNGQGADVLSEWAKSYEDGDDILRQVFAADPTEEAHEDPSPQASPFEWPALPDSARLSEEDDAGASPWLDGYVTFSKRWSPNGYDGFHAAVGLWLLSTVAARRVCLRLGGFQYTPLTVALAARSSLFAKTTTADVGTATLAAADLAWLLASDSATPAKFINDLAGHVPEDLESLPPATQERLRRRLAFAGQRGWFYEEFGQHVAAMMRADGPMGDFRGLLRRLDDCKDWYESGTIARGSERVAVPTWRSWRT